MCKLPVKILICAGKTTRKGGLSSSSCPRRRLSSCPKLLVPFIAGAVAITATAPLGLVEVEPGWGIKDFVNGCGVICNPSYLIDWTEQREENFAR